MTNNQSLKDYNQFLSGYGLATFEHRLTSRLFSFVYKIVNIDEAPIELKQSLKRKPLDSKYKLRNQEEFVVPRTSTHFGENTFSFFFCTLLNSPTLKTLFSFDSKTF